MGIFLVVLLLQIVWAGKTLWAYTDPKNEYTSCKFGPAPFIVAVSQPQSLLNIHHRTGASPVSSVTGHYAEAATSVSASSFNTLTSSPLAMQFWDYQTQKMLNSTPLTGHQPSSLNSVARSRSGNLVATTTNLQNGATNVTWWWTTNGRSDFWLGEEGYPARNTFVSDNGSLVIIDLSGRVVAVDTTNPKTPIFDKNLGHEGNANVFCASSDGRYFAYGSGRHLQLFQYAGKTFQQLTNYHIQDEGVTCALTDSLLVVSTVSKFGIDMWQMVFNFKNNDPIWEFDIKKFGPNNAPSQTVTLPDGKYFAVSTWGNVYKTAPQLNIWNTSSPAPIYQVPTPGSLNAVDIVEDKDGSVYVVSCGRLSHRSIRGSGGYIVLAQVV